MIPTIKEIYLVDKCDHDETYLKNDTIAVILSDNSINLLDVQIDTYNRYYIFSIHGLDFTIFTNIEKIIIGHQRRYSVITTRSILPHYHYIRIGHLPNRLTPKLMYEHILVGSDRFTSIDSIIHSINQPNESLIWNSVKLPVNESQFSKIGKFLKLDKLMIILRT